MVKKKGPSAFIQKQWTHQVGRTITAAQVVMDLHLSKATHIAL